MSSQELVIKGRFFDLHDASFPSREMTIVNGRIVAFSRCRDESLPFVVPNLRNAHNHIESTKLPPVEAARMLVAHGTDGMVSDPHELANVIGADGVRFISRESQRIPLFCAESPVDFLIGIPPNVPASHLENSGAVIGVEEVAQLISELKRTVLAEVMNAPGVLSGNLDVHAKLAIAHQKGILIDGHAPGLVGERAEKYFSYGISTDHECMTFDEALSKLQCPGVKIIIRDGSAARNFEALVGLIDQYPGRIMFCTDDLEPEDLIHGDIAPIVRKALNAGCDVANVMRAASVTPVEHYRLNRGMLRLNDRADFSILDSDLKTFHVAETYVGGRLVARCGKPLFAGLPVNAINNFQAKHIEVGQLGVPARGTHINVIEAVDGQLITNAGVYKAKIQDGKAVSDLENDILKIVVLNRYHPGAQPVIGFIKNFGLKRGALASTVMHDSHNIIAVGVDDKDIVNAINRLIDKGGGQVAACGDDLTILPLEIGGLMSLKTAEEVADLSTQVTRKALAFGSTLKAPFMTLSFMGLSVIPNLKITDVGMIDVSLFAPTSLWATT